MEIRVHQVEHDVYLVVFIGHAHFGRRPHQIHNVANILMLEEAQELHLAEYPLAVDDVAKHAVDFFIATGSPVLESFAAITTPYAPLPYGLDVRVAFVDLKVGAGRVDDVRARRRSRRRRRRPLVLRICFSYSSTCRSCAPRSPF